jgi:hypothetical protein
VGLGPQGARSAVVEKIGKRGGRSPSRAPLFANNSPMQRALQEERSGTSYEMTAVVLVLRYERQEEIEHLKQDLVTHDE